MDSFIIIVDGKEYNVLPQEQNHKMLYIIKAGDADVVFCANDNGEIIPRDEANPVELLQQIGRAISSHFS